MAELSTLARPYAKAAFDYANESSTIGDWEDFLFIATSVVSDESFKQLLNDPSVSAEQKTDVLMSIYDEQVTSTNATPLKELLFSQQNRNAQGTADQALPAATKEIKNFVMQLAEQDRLSLIPQVYEQYHLLRVKTLKQIDAYITSAYPLNESQREMIQQRLEASLNASVVLHESVDSKLLAGATIKIGDKVVDDSALGRLKQLRTQLIA